MNERAAGDILLLRAFESTSFVRWTDEDRAWASRSALQTVGADASPESFLAARAQAGLRRLEPLDPLLPRWRALRPWRGEWWWLAGALGLLLGLLADRIGPSQRINLLAPPVWALIAWNVAVYVALLLGRLLSPATPGLLRRGLASAWLHWRTRAVPATGDSAAAWSQFVPAWMSLSRPLNAARLALALHLGAAAIALGLLAGMYLRGLVLDYRVSWQSTFLDAPAVHALLGTLLGPAAALSGIALPDVAGLQALRAPLSPGADAASAAPWIHLYALTLAGFVVLPRLLLAGLAGARLRRLRQQFPLPLDEPYFQRLLRQQRGQSLPVRVWPHARAPEAPARAALQRLMAGAFGPGAALQLAPTVAYGAEEAPAEAQTGGALRLVLCDLGATPEPESQGRLLQALTPPGAAPPWLLLDEAAFRQRFGATSPRIAERRQAWRALAEGRAAGIVFAALQDGADLAEAEVALQAALQVASQPS
jgi:hypothetical protein